MRKLSFDPLTPLTYGTCVTALILVGLAIAEIALTAKTLHAFRHIEVQYPGSSLAEWKFVDMNPANIDAGPTSANFTVGAGSLASALLTTLWIVLVVCGVDELKVRRRSTSKEPVQLMYAERFAG
jgi:hypothetical protein